MKAKEEKTKEKSNETMTFFFNYNDNNINFIDAKNHSITCGDIWMANIPERDGNIQGGHRPVLVVSNDKNNKFSNIVNVVPMTTKMNKRNLPCHVEIWDYQKYGLTAPSTIMVEQITTINKENLRYYMGEINDVDMLMRIFRAMQVQFPMMSI